MEIKSVEQIMSELYFDDKLFIEKEDVIDAAVIFARQFIDLAAEKVSECNETWNTASKVRDIKQLIK